MDKVFSVFWIHGTRNIISGETIEAAFAKYWGGGAISAVDHYAEGYDLSRYWSTSVHDWVQKTVCRKSFEDIPELTFMEVQLLLKTNSHIIVSLPDSNDTVSISFDSGNFVGIGDVVYYCVQYNESIGYDSSEDGCESFLVSKRDLFATEDIAKAIKSFLDRLKPGNAYKNSYDGSSNLETIVKKSVFLEGEIHVDSGT